MLEIYPRALHQAGRYDSTIAANHYYSRFSKAEIVEEIDDGNPVVAGISPSGYHRPGTTAEHVALIVGYRDEGDVLIVNDPFPFGAIGMSDPYLAAGAYAIYDQQYEIDYHDFYQQLQWTESFSVERITDDDDGGGSYPSYCCTQAGKLGPVSERFGSGGWRLLRNAPPIRNPTGSGLLLRRPPQISSSLPRLIHVKEPPARPR
jgi:hypothetical protein